MPVILKLIIISILLVLKSKLINSSHFFGGSLSSRPIQDNNTTVIMEFTIRFAYRRDFLANGVEVCWCDQSIIDDRLLFGPVAYIYCRKNCLKSNEIIGTTSIYCIAFSEQDNWSYGYKSFNYKVKKTDDYEVSYTGNAWGKLVVYGYNNTSPIGAESWEVRHKLDSTVRNDTGKINSSPTTLMSPIVTLPKNIQYTIPIPFTDDDNDIVRCRWASWMKKECADVCEAVPFAKLNNCELNLNLTDATMGWYAVALQIEDFKTENDTDAISSVPLQFLLVIVNASSCEASPYIVGDLPTDACIAENDFFTIRIVATVGCFTEDLTDIPVVGPSGSIVSDMIPLSGYQKTWYKTLSWNASKEGQYLICSKAVDTSFLVSRSSCYTVIVGVPITNINQSTIYPTGLIFPTNNFYLFRCNYTTDVLKPTVKAYINVRSAINGTIVYQIDSAAQSTTKFSDFRLMEFSIPNNVLSDGSYYLTFDYGVALSTVYCKPISPKIDNSSFWTFQINSSIITTTTTISSPTKSTSPPTTNIITTTTPTTTTSITSIITTSTTPPTTPSTTTPPTTPSTTTTITSTTTSESINTQNNIFSSIFTFPTMISYSSIIFSSNDFFIQSNDSISASLPDNITFLNSTYVSNCTVSGIILMSFLTVGSNILVHTGAYTVMFIYLNSKLVKSTL